MPQQPAGWTLVQPAPQPSVWTLVQPAATPEPEAPSFLDSALNFASNFTHTVDPRPALKVLYHGAEAIGGGFSGQPERGAAFLQDLQGIGGAQVDQFKKAKKAYDDGRISEAVGHTMAGALPLMGPAAANAGEQIGSGDVSGGLGTTAGILAPFGAADALKRMPAMRVPGIAANQDAAVAQAVEAGRAAGVPIDAATATGNPYVKFAQKTADESLLGSFVGGRAKTAQQAGLATMGEQIAQKARAGAVTPGQAGEATQQAVRDVVSGHRAAADAAYTKLRAIEADPANMATFEPEVGTPSPDAPTFFSSKPKPTAQEVFTDALKDARQQGYKGTASELKATFDQRLNQAKALKAETTGAANEYGHGALLKAIRDRGGLRPFDPDFIAGAPTQKMRGEFQAVQQLYKNNYGTNAVFKNGGLALDDMLQQLSEDPKWRAVITPDTDLIDLLHKGAMGPAAEIGGNVERYLQAVGVQPGVQWWNEGAPAQHVPMAVDLSTVKDAVRPIHAKLAAEAKLVPLQSGSGKGTAFVALDRLLNGPDVAPLSVADAALSDLKRMARSTDPNLRTVGQGIAARTVDALHREVGAAAERAGPEAVSALEEGRTATKAKYAAADVLQRLAGRAGTKSPVAAFRGLTAQGDLGLATLRDTLKQSPDSKPLIARAVLDRVVDMADKPQTALTQWQKLGPDTKQALFTPEHTKAIDDFLLLRKKIADNPNPSGSGIYAMKGGELAAVMGGHIAYTLTAPMVSALLHSELGTRLLTRGFRLPVASTVARGAYLSALSKALQEAGQPALVPAYAGAPQQ